MAVYILNIQSFFFFFLGKKISELERLQKAIETVKNEVEESQKKLLQYKYGTQTVQDVLEGDSNCNILKPIEEEEKVTSNKKLDISVSSSKKKKYVIDRSCPATDMEYDPLLNYTAGFFSSTTKENENKTTKKQKSEEIFENPQKKPRGVSPIRLEIKLQESDEEDMLVIDAPPMEVVSRRKRPSKACNSIEKPTAMNVADVSTEETGATMECQVLPPEEDCDAKCASETNELEVPPEVLTGCTNDIAQQQNDHCDAQISSEENTTSIVNESKNDETDVSVNSKETIEQTQLVSENVVTKQYSYLTPFKLCGSDIFSAHATDLKIIDATTTTSLDTAAADALPINEPKYQPETSYMPKEDVIVLNSSTDDSSEEDTMSDSEDPMEECLRIFNEFTECEAKKKANQVFCDNHIFLKSNVLILLHIVNITQVIWKT